VPFGNGIEDIGRRASPGHLSNIFRYRHVSSLRLAAMAHLLMTTPQPGCEATTGENRNTDATSRGSCVQRRARPAHAEQPRPPGTNSCRLNCRGLNCGAALVTDRPCPCPTALPSRPEVIQLPGAASLEDDRTAQVAFIDHSAAWQPIKRSSLNHLPKSGSSRICRLFAMSSRRDFVPTIQRIDCAISVGEHQRRERPRSWRRRAIRCASRVVSVRDYRPRDCPWQPGKEKHSYE
jgi:hypothetical protein